MYKYSFKTDGKAEIANSIPPCPKLIVFVSVLLSISPNLFQLPARQKRFPPILFYRYLRKNLYNLIISI